MLGFVGYTYFGQLGFVGVDMYFHQTESEKVLIIELISSDESESKEDAAVLVVKGLTWRSNICRVSNFFTVVLKVANQNM